MKNAFDAIVVGGGHAGVEATRALAAIGKSVALLSLDPKRLSDMSCNPAIGGVAKSHLVFEIDALGGLMGACADVSGIQARRLNSRKGPAVRATRVQCDKKKYSDTMSEWVASLPNVQIVSGEASKVLVENQKVTGIELKDGSQLFARAVLITTGTFMKGLMFCGEKRSIGGRFGDKAADTISDSLKALGHTFLRLKTGTPARLDARTIDFASLERQWGDPEQRQFSWRKVNKRLPQLSCYLTYTNEDSHDVIRSYMHESPLFSGEIVGVGPRYCPSIEDKVKRFPERERHQIFLEPEGLNTNFIYPNGMSTSLSEEVQKKFFKTIKGLEHVEILRPGYAVEYDSVEPRELNHGLMSKFVEGLFMAGQVNRTSGYEEAAAQGLWAGIQCGLFLSNKAFLELDRSRSYIETLVYDLTTVGTMEPYRLFTSRSEYRLLLREDNAQERYFDLAQQLGLLSDEQKMAFELSQAETTKLKAVLLQKKVRLTQDRVISSFEYLKRPEVSWESFAAEVDEGFSDLSIERVEIDAKYAGYLVRQEEEVRALRDIQFRELVEGFEPSWLSSASHEELDKLSKFKPKTMRDVMLISGITPATVLAISKYTKPSVPRETFC